MMRSSGDGAGRLSGPDENTPLLNNGQTPGRDEADDPDRDVEANRSSIISEESSWAATPDTTDTESADLDFSITTPADFIAVPIQETEPLLVPELPRPPHQDSREGHTSPSTPPSEHADESREEPPHPLNNLSPRRVRVIFSLILSTHFLACFDGTIIVSSHPVITSYFHSSNTASLLSTAFFLTSIAFTPLVGRLSDATGRKPLYVCSMAVFTAGTAWCALAPTMLSLVLARAMCGIGAGGVVSLGRILISDMIPIEQRANWQSTLNIMCGIGSASGAALGGVIADFLNWRSEFGVQVIPLTMCIAIAIVAVPPHLGKTDDNEGVWEALKMFDFRGSVLLTTSLICYVLGMSLVGNVFPWQHPFVITSMCIFTICFPIFLYWQTLAQRPIMPFRLLNLSPYMNLIFANFVTEFLVSAIMFNAPIFFQAVLLQTPTSTGLHLVPPILTASLTAALTARLITRYRRLHWPLMAGITLLLLGTVFLSQLRRTWPSVLYLLALLPPSLGHGLHSPATAMAVLNESHQRDHAAATSTLHLWRSIGAMLGVALTSSVLQCALWGFLDKNVGGPRKEEVIALVRSSVEAVAELEGGYREEVFRSYEMAMSAVFWYCGVVGVMAAFLIAPVRLQRLRGGRWNSNGSGSDVREEE